MRPLSVFKGWFLSDNACQVVMFIMVYLAFRKHRDLNSTLLTIFYRDGIFYFICLSSRFRRFLHFPSG